jgi:23S rRNA pseudouridine955/2504/2580 synthase/23S rRNA pseudouridine1911/1915/1917 synthase
LTIFYEDEHLLVVDKPSGLLTIPDRFGNKESLQAELEKRYGKVFVVHRLDRETSGILCFARNEAAHRHLSMQFEHHTTDKFYHALVDGVLHHEEGEINKPIGEHPTIPGKMVVASWGKPSLTFYRALEHFAHFTLVETLIKTGRTHQIRVHLKHIGYPLAVDAVYGRREAFFLSEVKGKKYKSGKFTEEEEKPLMARSSLHSSRLRLDHPVTEERLEFRSELPKDFGAVLNQLRKWDKP